MSKLSPIRRVEARWVASLALAALLAEATLGCVAPGSGVARYRVMGEVRDATGAPVPDARVTVTAPLGFGLHPDEAREPVAALLRAGPASATTDEAGRFAIDLDTVYHVTVWLLPPLGGFPRRPPPPRGFTATVEKPGHPAVSAGPTAAAPDYVRRIRPLGATKRGGELAGYVVRLDPIHLGARPAPGEAPAPTPSP